MLYDARGRIVGRGLARAKAEAQSKFERVCLDAAAAMLDRTGPATVMYGGQIGAVLPRRRTASRQSVFRSQSTGRRYRLSSPPGLGLPFGSAARLILLQLQTLAVETGARTFPFPESLHAWGRGMGAAMGGRDYQIFIQQAHLIGNARVQVTDEEGAGAMQEFAFVDGLEFAGVGAQPPAALLDWTTGTLGLPHSVTLSPGFFAHLRDRAQPLDRDAVLLLHSSSWALDAYIWLADILPRLEAPTVWTWPMLAAQFGASYKQPQRIKANLLRAASLALAVYAAAEVELGEAGLTLHPAPSPAA